jgi:hypothetical protein
MSTLLSRAGMQTQMGGEHSKLARGAQQIGAWTQVQTDNKLAWRRADCSLIVDQTMGSQRPPQGQLVPLLELLGPLHGAWWRALDALTRPGGSW